jgi:hypothetical protein
MTKKLQKRRIKTQVFRQANILSSAIPKQKVTAETRFTNNVSAKTPYLLSESKNFEYIKYDLKRSLVIAAALLALLVILYFFLPR